MTPWWSQAFVDHWGVAIFNCLFWPLTCLGSTGMQQGRSAKWVRIGRNCLVGGIALGLVLLGLWVAALAAGQPVHVHERLALYGGLLTVIHGSLLAGMVYARRARTGGTP